MFFQKASWTIALGATLGLFLGSGAATAGGAKDGFVGPDGGAKAFVMYSGFDVANDVNYAYQGLIYSFNRDIGRDGFLLRLYGSHVDYEYDNSGVPGGKVDGDGWQGDVMIGYKIGRGVWWAAGYIGVDYQDHDLTPNDFSNPVRGSEVGFKVSADMATLREGTPLYFSLGGEYSTAFNSYWARARVGLNQPRYTFGPEFIAMGSDSFDAQRVGAFLTFDLNLTPTMPIEVTISGGYQFVGDSNNGDSFGSGGGEGGYGGVNFTVLF
ncbi:MAG TPA: cellulose biosynthesis protein BcsS [Hyphomicrobiaceae bacterium]|nr:cellulose biosynthesis protein BcsS [Hyphomicrobiaceae bacterium]